MFADFIHYIKNLFSPTPSIYQLPYQERAYIITLSTAVERVK